MPKREIAPIHPGEMLLEEFVKPYQITPKKLAKSINVAEGYIQELIQAKRNITPSLAYQICRDYEEAQIKKEVQPLTQHKTNIQLTAPPNNRLEALREEFLIPAHLSSAHLARDINVSSKSNYDEEQVEKILHKNLKKEIQPLTHCELYEEFSNFHELKQPIEISNEELRKRLGVPEPKPKTPPITYNEPPVGGTSASFPSAERRTEEPSTSELAGERET
ncbi:6047_t:CDS:2 [Funneliformis geosporum]|nr:6047_t:CDS:2 [Funneliformis geosporum]